MSNRFFFHIYLFLVLAAISCSQGSDQFTVVDTGVDYDLHAIALFDGQLYVTGGDVWNRSDLAISTGGDSWEVDSLTNKSLFDLHATDDHLYGVGTDGYIFRSEPDMTLYRTMYWGMLRGFTDAATGFVAVGGKDFNKGWIYKVNSELGIDTTYRFDHEINHVDCDGANCVAAGFGIILYSNDSGISWNQAQQTGDHYRSVAYNSSGTVFVIGNAGSLLESEDHGRTWNTIADGHSPLGTNRPYRMIKFFEDVGVIVGDKGTMLRSSDRGSTWERALVDTDLDLYDVTLLQGTFYIASEEGRVVIAQ